MRTRGFSLIEVMVTVTMLTVLLSLAMPSFTGWIRNAKVRSVSEALQSGMRVAQTEAVRRYQQVVFFRTDQKTCNANTTAVASGSFWAIRTIPVLQNQTSEAVKCGMLSDVAGGIQLAGPAALCFDSNGRQVAVASPGVGGGATCTLPQSGVATYDISSPNADPKVDHPLRVLINLGGSVRLCDPARTLSTTTPDGCPSAP